MRPLLALVALPLAAQTGLPAHLLPGRTTPPPRPLPDPAGLIARVMAKVEAVARLSESYLYREVETQEKLDSDGRPKSTQTSTYEVYRLPGGQQIRRLLERNGRPLNASEAQTEEVRVQASLKAALEAQDPTRPPQAKGKEVQLSPQDILAVCALGPVTRTECNGRPVLSLAFRPKPGASPKGMGQRLAHKLEGQLLIDEVTDQVVRAEGRLTESFWVGGGLVGAVVPPSTFVFQQAQVAEDLWMPVQGTFTLHARVAFVPFRMRMGTQCSGFQRFTVGEGTLGRAGGS